MLCHIYINLVESTMKKTFLISAFVDMYPKGVLFTDSLLFAPVLGVLNI